MKQLQANWHRLAHWWRYHLTCRRAPAIDVIVIGRDIEKYLPDAIQSVLQQTYPAKSIIYVDDGSSDPSAELARDLLRGHPRARVIVRNQGGGAGAARNDGLRAARSPYVVFLDGDDLLYPGALESFAQALRHGHADVVFSNRDYFIEAEEDIVPNTFFRERALYRSSPFDPELISRVAIHGKCFRRRFLRRHSIFFPENMSVEDYPFHYDVLGAARRLSFIPETTYRYTKRHAGGLSQTMMPMTRHSLQSRFRQIELTQAIVRRRKMTKKFPGVCFGRFDYQYRLMRHIRQLPGLPEREAKDALDQFRAFLQKHEEKALRSVRPRYRPLYQCILQGDLPTVLCELDRCLAPAA